MLVGGLGTRLKERTRDVPKPLLTVGGRPFLDYIIDDLVRQGFTEVLLLAGFLGEQVKALYHDKIWRNGRLRVVIEPQPMGTGGALRFAEPFLAEKFLLLNGDTFFDINLRALAIPESVPDDGLVMALRPNVEGTRFGRVTLTEGFVKGFHAPEPGRSGPINGGIYCLSRTVVQAIPPVKTSLEGDIFPGLADRGLIRGMEFGGFFLDIGVPEDLARAELEMPARTTRRAVFFDRDGVLNADTGYVHKPTDFNWIPGAKEAVRICNDNGYLVFVVTNQAGVAHGYYQEQHVRELHDWMTEELAREGAHIDAFEYCPHHPQGRTEAYRRPCRRRKPGGGMIEDLLSHWPTDRNASFLIGDKQSDLDAAAAARINGYLFEGGNLTDLVQDILRRDTSKN